MQDGFFAHSRLHITSYGHDNEPLKLHSISVCPGLLEFFLPCRFLAYGAKPLFQLAILPIPYSGKRELLGPDQASWVKGLGTGLGHPESGC